jgi:hypothetical protein
LTIFALPRRNVASRDAAHEIGDSGCFSFLERSVTAAELNTLMEI